jgi:sialic acid synthase SpsE
MVVFGNRRVGDGEPCFITFEAGPTHNGVESAKHLVSLAAKAGADAIKFQIIDPDRLVADKKQLFSYEILTDRGTGETLTISEPLYDILCRRTLDPEEWKDLKAHSDSMGLAFFATVGFEDEIELLEELECDSIKIASADVNHWPLIQRAARTGMCIQLDTGNATMGEIEEAVGIIVSEGNKNIIIHNCPSGYPARLESINLNLILTLKQIFPYPVGFSDHTPGWEMDVAAVAVGANLLEKTIT